MGFHTFVATEVLTASNVMTYLMKQAVITCTAGTRPASPVQGMTIYQTDTNSYFYYNGTVWDVLPGGLVASSTGANTVTSSGSTETFGTGAGLTLTASLSSTRTYRVEASNGLFTSNGSGQVTVRVRVSTGAVNTGSFTVAEARAFHSTTGAPGGYGYAFSGLWTPASTGSWNLAVSVIGTSTPTNGSYGPSGLNPILAVYGI